MKLKKRINITKIKALLEMEDFAFAYTILEPKYKNYN